MSMAELAVALFVRVVSSSSSVIADNAVTGSGNAVLARLHVAVSLGSEESVTGAFSAASNASQGNLLADDNWSGSHNGGLDSGDDLASVGMSRSHTLSFVEVVLLVSLNSHFD